MVESETTGVILFGLELQLFCCFYLAVFVDVRPVHYFAQQFAIRIWAGRIRIPSLVFGKCKRVG